MWLVGSIRSGVIAQRLPRRREVELESFFGRALLDRQSTMPLSFGAMNGCVAGQAPPGRHPVVPIDGKPSERLFHTRPGARPRSF
jgi:hypothetical protein